MKILILGGTRFIGKAIATASIQAGHQVHLFNRGQSPSQSDLPTIQGDLKDLASFKEHFQQLKPDVVVHCMALSEGDAQRAVETFAGLDCQLLVLGSADCYEAFQQLNRGKEVSDFPLAENAPLSTIRHYYNELMPSRALAEYDKNLMTDALMAAGQQGLICPTVFRLPMIWGPEDYQYAGRHGAIVRRIYDQQKRYVLGAAQQQTIWHFAYVDNIAAAIVHAYGLSLEQQVFNLGEPQVRSWRRWVQLYAEVSQFDFEIEVLPDELLDSEHKANNPPQHMMLDTSLFRQLTGFKEPVDLQTAIQANLEWGLSHSDVLGGAPNYQHEAELVKKYRAFHQHCLEP